MAKWLPNKEFHPDKIIEKLNKITSIDAIDNQFRIDYSYPDYSYNGLVIVLANMLNISAEISEIKKLDFLQQAIQFVRQKGDLTEDRLLGQVSRLENQYLAHSKFDFILVTFISADGWFNEPKLANRLIHNATITFSHRLPRNFQLAHDEIKSLAKNIILRSFPEKYQAVRVKVSARSATEAAELALDRLDLLRAIWNFSITRNSWLHPRLSGGIRTPINALVLGPLHTIHKTNGEKATDVSQWWYEPSYIAPITPFKVNQNGERMYKWEKWIRGQLNQLPYRVELENILVRYVRALDDTNWQNTFLVLWSILERLTCTTGTYDKTIKRTAFLYRDIEYHIEILNHLRRHRNDLVHDENNTIFFEALSYQAKYYVDQLFEFHLVNEYKHNSLADAADFLDSPTNEDKLKANFQRLKNVIKFRDIEF